MKKRLNIFCVCMIAAFLLSVSGNVYLIIEMFTLDLHPRITDKIEKINL